VIADSKLDMKWLLHGARLSLQFQTLYAKAFDRDVYYGFSMITVLGKLL